MFAQGIATRRGIAVLAAVLSVALAISSQRGRAENWTGVSLGGNIMWSGISGAQSLRNETRHAGVHVGYDHDFGKYVLGGEIELDRTNVTIGAVELDTTNRIKLRAGYDFGPLFAYVTAGSARASTSTGLATGSVVGLGVFYSVTEYFFLGGEALRQNFDALGAAAGRTSVDTLSIRASFRF